MKPLPSVLEDAYVFRMTDDTGMFQHAQYDVPDPSHGYTTDDNARALIMAAMLFEVHGQKKYLDLVYRYLTFMLYAEAEGWLCNFMRYDRLFVKEKGSQDCFGRSLWALGSTASSPSLPEPVRAVAKNLFDKAAGNCDKLIHLRSMAYAVLGLVHRDNDRARQLADCLANNIVESYHRTAVSDWRWFEDKLTYCNAVLPWALMEAYTVTRKREFLDIGLESLGFLSENTFRQGVFWPIGCKGWYARGSDPAKYDQQPVEACETLLASLKAFELTGDNTYLTRSRQCLAWYFGENSLSVSLIEPKTGGCKDGIMAAGLNPNQGAESLVSSQIAWLAWRTFAGNMS